MRLYLPLALLVTVMPVVFAVFADDAYHTDYQFELLGIPLRHTTFFHRPQANSKASLLYTFTRRSVLGAVNPRDGTVVWRQSLDTQRNSTDRYLAAADGENTVFSGFGDAVNAWDATSGRFVWEQSFLDEKLKALEITDLDSETIGAKDVIALFDGKKATVRRFDATTGNVKWTYVDESNGIPLHVSCSPRGTYYVSLQSALLKGYKIKVVSVDPATGVEKDHYILNSESEVSSVKQVLFVGSNRVSPFIIWTDKDFKTLKVNIIGTKQINTIPIVANTEIDKVTIHVPQEPSSPTHFLAQFDASNSHWGAVYHVDLSESTAEEAYVLPRLGGAGSFSASSQGTNLYFVRVTESEVALISSASHGILARWPLKRPKKSAGIEGSVHSTSEVIAKDDSHFAVRVASVSTDGTWELIHNGQSSWMRRELLAGAVAADWAELTDGESLAQELAIEEHEHIWDAYVHRVRRHVNDLHRLPKWLKSFPTWIVNNITGQKKDDLSTTLEQDKFGFKKLVIVATENGYLVALASGHTPEVVWETKIAALEEGKHWGIASLTVKDKSIIVLTNSFERIRVDTLTGKVLQRTKSGLNEWSTIIDVPDAQGNFVSVPVRQDGMPEALTDNSLSKDTVIVTMDKDHILKGWSFEDGTRPINTWTFSPATGEEVIGTAARPFHDPIASIGKVLGNRSVLYKYLNVNMILITAASKTASTVSFYLLDSVSGETLYQVTYRDVDTSRPITSAMSENWFVASFFSAPDDDTVAHGPILLVSELYESEFPNDRGPLGSSANYSSLHTPNLIAKPYVLTQSFVIPSEISHMSVTSTNQGITSRQLLCYVPSSHAIVGIPRAVLDPRRPIGRDPNPAELEEGLFKYSPVLEFEPRWYLTHRREIIGVKDVITRPSRLESTSLIFAYGLDIFGTRVAPSQTFDMLSKSFSKMQLIITVAALAGVVWALAPVVRRKQIDSQWR